MALLESSWGIYVLIVQLLVYLAILANVVLRKGMDRLVFFIVVSGYFIISFTLDDFLLSSTYICIWFAFSGIDFFVSKELLIVLLIVMLLLGYSNPFFYLLSMVLYAITLSNFLFSSYHLAKHEVDIIS